MNSNATEPQTGESVLKSLPHYDSLRLNATGSITREEGSNVDVFQDPDTEEEVILCHLSGLFPFTYGGSYPSRLTKIEAAAAALAAHHLNVGDGSIVPEVEGLNERCNVRFTVEFGDTELDKKYSLNQVVDLIGREKGTAERLPCAFLGAASSMVSVPTSIVTGLFGYPQVSAMSTSADLDDKSQHQLFGRTIPNDADNAVPFILYLRDVLHVTKLAVVHVNDPYGNAYAVGLQEAAREYAPIIDIRSIPMREGEHAEKDTLEALEETGFRYIFCVLYKSDELMTEAYKMDLAGNGKHNWIFGDGFRGVADRYEKGSPLSLAYRGIGKLDITGGLPGIAAYDRFTAQMVKLTNPEDLQYLGSIFPKLENPETGSPPFVEDSSFLSLPLSSNFASLTYDAAIALGLSACSGISGDGFMDGETHFKHFVESSFAGASGHVSFDNVTGTRDVTGAIFRLTNFVPTEVVDDETGETVVSFTPYVTDVFQDGKWEEVREFIFSDGTPNVPPDSPPRPTEEELQWVQSILLPIAIALVAAIGIFLFFERKRRQSDSLWYIKKEELKFADPPEIIGRGAFGLILKAEYRGTDVAVKRILPPRQGEREWKLRGSTVPGSVSTSDSPLSKAQNKGRQHHRLLFMRDKGSAQSVSSLAVLGRTSVTEGERSMVANGSSETSRSKLKKNFIKEMRVLSKLRHSCIATVMGAVLERGSEPMLIMEYMDHGSLYDVLHNETMHIESNLLLHILQDVSQGMRFLHSSIPQVVHCDIKSANILVDSRFRAKVADFGLSHDKYVNGITGTAYWMAPELLRGESGNTTASDVYAFGIVLYEIYSRREPYDGEDPVAILHLVADKLVQKRPPIPQHMPAQIQSLMHDCIQDDASLRPTFQEIDQRLKRMDIGDLRTISDDPKRAATTDAVASMSLFDIFPKHVAQALREGRAVEPEHRDMVTIFFSDIVGYTQLSANLPPRKVALLLNRLYTKFDALSQKHDVFKVETIGDAYMAVTNLVKDQEKDHAKRIAEFAIDAIREANETLVDEEDPEKGHVNIRVGFHSGSVVADVVGTRNLRYCLFGDSVNTASRMESSSKANRIHCSSASAEILAKQCPSLPVKSRGLIPIKGKGEMQTCWVNEGNGSRILKVKDDESAMIHWAKGQGKDQDSSLARRRSAANILLRSSPDGDFRTANKVLDIEEEASTTSESDPKV
eukprot:scaffold1844_cov124-Cylindrotheca_fusiformis.AAC.2